MLIALRITRTAINHNRHFRILPLTKTFYTQTTLKMSDDKKSQIKTAFPVSRGREQ